MSHQDSSPKQGQCLGFPLLLERRRGKLGGGEGDAAAKHYGSRGWATYGDALVLLSFPQCHARVARRRRPAATPKGRLLGKTRIRASERTRAALNALLGEVLASQLGPTDTSGSSPPSPPPTSRSEGGPAKLTAHQQASHRLKHKDRRPHSATVHPGPPGTLEPHPQH